MREPKCYNVLEWLLNNDFNLVPRFWKRKGSEIGLTEDFDPDAIEYQFEITPSTDDISDVYAF